MTWLKLSDDFGDECARADLSDAAMRTHVEGLLWCMRRETGGALTKRDVRRFAETADPDAAVTELVNSGFWIREGDGYRVVQHMEHQPEPDVIDRRRSLTADRVRKHRRKRAGLEAEASNGVTERVTRVGSGRDGEPKPSATRRTKGTPETTPKVLCETCNEPLSAPAVAAGWTVHPLCEEGGAEWPGLPAIPA